MAETLHMTQISSPGSMRKLILVLFLIAVIAGGYVFLCFTLGKTAQTELLAWMNQINDPGSPIQISELKMDRGIFHSRYRAKILFNWNGRNEPRRGQQNQPFWAGVIRVNARHTPIPFGKGFGRLISFDIVADTDAARSRPNISIEGKKLPRLLISSNLHLDLSVSSEARLLASSLRTPDGRIELPRSGRMAIAFERSGLMNAMAVKVPELVWSDRVREGQISDLSIKLSARELTGRMGISAIANFGKLIATERSGYRNRNSLELSKGKLYSSIRNLGAKPARIFAQETFFSDAVINHRIEPAFISELMHLIQNSPMLRISLRSEMAANTRDAVKLNLEVTFPGSSKIPTIAPFSDAKGMVSMSLPKAFLDSGILSPQSRRSLNRLVRNGVLKQSQGKFETELRYDRQRLFVNGKSSNVPLFYLFR